MAFCAYEIEKAIFYKSILINYFENDVTLLKGDSCYRYKEVLDMQNLQQGPGDNFATKFNLYGKMLFKISMVYLGNKEDAEEAMQEVFYKLLYKSPHFNENEHEKAWLIRTMVNYCKDMLRSSWRKSVVKMEDIEPYYSNSTDLGIMEELLKLPPKYKAVIHLHYYEGYSVREIAVMLEVKESAVKMRLQRGRQLLKMELEGAEMI